MSLAKQRAKIKEVVVAKAAEKKASETAAAANGWVSNNPGVIAGWTYIMKIPLTLVSDRPDKFLADWNKENVGSNLEKDGHPKDVRDKMFLLVSQYGWHHNNILLASGIKRESGGGLLSKIGDVVTDVAKGIAYVAAAPVNSVTGHTFDPKFQTKVGGVLGGTAVIGTDSVNLVAKTFADTISGGLATKAANLVRKDENKEQVGAYMESKSKTTEVGALKGFEAVSKGGAVLIGTYIGTKVLQNNQLAQDINEIGHALTGGGDGFETVSSEPYVDPSTQGDNTFMFIILGLFGAFLILK